MTWTRYLKTHSSFSLNWLAWQVRMLNMQSTVPRLFRPCKVRKSAYVLEQVRTLTGSSWLNEIEAWADTNVQLWLCLCLRGIHAAHEYKSCDKFAKANQQRDFRLSWNLEFSKRVVHWCLLWVYQKSSHERIALLSLKETHGFKSRKRSTPDSRHQVKMSGPLWISFHRDFWIQESLLNVDMLKALR